MAWRIHDHVVRGEVDNRIEGRITGRIWLEGRQHPIRLELEGNASEDLAGCMLTFENPNPRAGTPGEFAPEQTGRAGEFTASKKVRVPCEAMPHRAAGCPEEPVRPWGNGIYLEWFSHLNGRVLIEAADYILTMSEPMWRLGDKLNALKAQIQKVSGGNCLMGSSGRLSPKMEEEFLKRVLAYEMAHRMTYRQMLARDRFCPVEPKQLGEGALHDALWKLIEALAKHRVYLEFTDHLSDRELYEFLWHRLLNEEDAGTPGARWNTHVDVSEYGGPRGQTGEEIYLRYYADSSTRDQWRDDFDLELPPQEDPPHDRDGQLPRPEDGVA